MTDPQNGAVVKVPPKAKERSPNYPAIPLSESIPQVLKLYNAEKRTIVSSESAARALGYGALSGTARSLIAALRQFGLVENVGEGLRVSELAMAILHNPPGSEERTAALRVAAMKPPLIAELIATHAEASPESLRAYLITKRKFAPDGAGRLVETFRDALNYIGGAVPEPDADGDDDTPPPIKEQLRGGRTSLADKGKEKRVMQFGGDLSGDAVVSITVTGEFDEDDVDTFDLYVKVARKSMLKAIRAAKEPAATTPPAVEDSTNGS